MSAPRRTEPPALARFSLGKVAGRIAAIMALSVVLGLGFNASNPIGLRWGDPPPPAAPSKNATAAQPGASSSASNMATSVNSIATLPPVPVPVPMTQAVVASGVVASNNPDPAPPVEPRVFRPEPAKSVLLTITPPNPTSAPPAMVAGASSNSPSTPIQLEGVNPAPTHWVEVRTLVEKGEAVLVDVRPKPVYDAGHIPGAISLPETSTLEEIAQFREKYPQGKLLILYCSSTSCSMSQRMARRFVTEFGYTSVKYMTGGYMEWQQAQQAERAKGTTP